jgi:hypothetical protein
MHSALFVAKIPAQERQDWADFLAFIDQKIGADKSVIRLAENVWLTNFRGSPSALGWLSTTAERKGILYGILPFDAELQWLPVGFDPKTIQVQSAKS